MYQKIFLYGNFVIKKILRILIKNMAIFKKKYSGIRVHVLIFTSKDISEYVALSLGLN